MNCYRRNLAALEGFQPDVAAAVEQTPVPEGISPAKGRDGSDTFLIPARDGRREWLGGSSMPAVSAPEIFAGFRSDGRNVALPGVLTGLEPLVVAAKLPSHTALFVVERELPHLKLAMRLYDYAELIAAGRIVFVPGNDEMMVEVLRRFFAGHLGFELPTHLLTVPQRTSAQIAELQQLLEKAGAEVNAIHVREMESLARAIGGRTFGSLPKVPGMAVISVDPSPASVEQGRRIERALTKLGWPHRVCLPDAPDKCHVVARLQAIADSRADLVLVINGTGGRMRHLLPDGLPVACWFLPGACVQGVDDSEKKGREVIFSSSQALYDALAGNVAPAEMIEHCAMAADDAVFRPLHLSAGDDDARHVDVAILMDLPDDRAEACNITLPSHAALWEAIRETVARWVDRYHGGLAEELLEKAQQKSGTTLHDAEIRALFTELLRARAAPAAIARAAVEAILAEGYRVELWGRNWPAPGGRLESRSHTSQRSHTRSLVRESLLAPERHDIRRGAIPLGEALNRVFNTAGVVVVPDSSPPSVQIVLDALAAGAQVICRRPDEPFEKLYPGLATLVPHLNLYRTTGELLQTVRALTARGQVDSEGREQDGSAAARSEVARSVVLSEHTVAQRLISIVEAMGRRRAPATHESR